MVEEGDEVVAPLLLRGELAIDRDLAVDKQADSRLVDFLNSALQHDLPDDVQVKELGRVAANFKVGRLVTIVYVLLIVVIIERENGSANEGLILSLPLLWLHSLLNLLCCHIGANEEHLDEVEARERHRSQIEHSRRNLL